jgi:hypothetical protein
MKKLLTVVLVSVLTIFGQWSLILIPDTQYDLGSIFTNATQWIKAHKDSLNLKFVLHLGDIVNHGTLSEMNSARSSMGVLDGVVPYAIPPGNHDYGGGDSWGYYRQAFPVSDYSSLPTWGGTMEAGKLENSYHLFSADGTDYLIIALEFMPTDSRLVWANSIVSAHPNRKVIYDTHWYMSSGGVRGTGIRSQGQNSGEDQWNEFVRQHPGMLLTVSGHVESGASRRVDKGLNGNFVYQMLSNYQSMGWGTYHIRILTFYPWANRIAVRTYSPGKDQYLDGFDHKFDIDLIAGAYIPPQPAASTDPTAPGPPGNFTAAGISTGAVQLNWSAGSDAESGVPYYRVKRGDEYIGVSTGLSYIDSGLSEAAQYTYTVIAVNGSGLASTAVGPVQASTLADTKQPEIISLYAKESEVNITYSEPMDLTSTVNPANYTFSGSIAISSITLSADKRAVVIATSSFTPNISYTLTISNVKDTSLAHNAITANTQRSFIVPAAFLLVDFGATAAANQFEVSGWNTVIKDNYTGYVSAGPGGMAITTGANGGYNYQGVTGSATAFGSSEKITVTWYNSDSNSITFTPKISFTETGRPSSGGTWYNMSALTLAGSSYGVTEYAFTSSTAGNYSVVNVSSNENNYGTIVCDMIEWMGSGSSLTASTRFQETFSLVKISPNPFNASTRIAFSRFEEGPFSLKVFDLKGVLVKDLTFQAKKEAKRGWREVLFNAEGLPSGLYLLNMKAGNSVVTKPMFLQR